MKPVASAPPPPLADLWTAGRGYVRVMLKDMVTQVRIGVHPWERHPEKPQRLIVNVDLFAYQDAPHAGEEVSAVLDYDRIRDFIAAWRDRAHVALIETLIEELIAHCFQHPRVAACRVGIVKPDVFKDAAGAGVEVYRLRTETLESGR